MNNVDEMTTDEYRRLVGLFVDNVWLFIANTERILSDSHMAQAIVPVHNGVYKMPQLAGVTLGVYVKWWRDCPVESHDEFDNPIWRIAGYPFRGFSRCASVTADGEIRQDCRVRSSIKNVWQSFMNVVESFDCKDNPIKAPYSLSEVIEILTNETAERDPYVRLLQSRLSKTAEKVTELTD